MKLLKTKNIIIFIIIILLATSLFFLFGCSGPDQDEIRISSDNSHQSEPDIYGERIVWQDMRDYLKTGTDIYMYDLSLSEEIPITTKEGFQGYPSIYGDKIVWMESNYENQR